MTPFLRLARSALVLLALLDVRARCNKVTTRTHMQSVLTQPDGMSNIYSPANERGLTDVICMRQTQGIQAYVISGVEERWLSTTEVLAGLGIQAQRILPVKPSPKLAEREFSVRALFRSYSACRKHPTANPAVVEAPEAPQGLLEPASKSGCHALQVHNYDAHTNVNDERTQREFSLLATFKKVFRMVSRLPGLRDDQFALLFEDDIAVHGDVGAQVKAGLLASVSACIPALAESRPQSCIRGVESSKEDFFNIHMVPPTWHRTSSGRCWRMASAWRAGTACCTWAAARPAATTPARCSTGASRS